MKKISSLINNLVLYLDRYPLLFLIIIVFFGLVLRTINLKDNIIFAYDQARDAQRVYDILFNKHLKIVGPETDIPGVFNGPLLYYILLPIYAFSNFNPNIAALCFVFMNLTAVIFLYILSKILLNNKKTGLIAAFLWSISYEQMNFSRFISNASLMSIATILFFLGLAIYLFSKREVIGLMISVIGLSAAIHFNFYLVYLIIFYPIFLVILKKMPKLLHILMAVVLLIILLSPFIIAELKFHFMGIKSLANYFLHQSKTYSSQHNVFAYISENARRYYDRLSEAIDFSFFSFGKFIGIIIFGIFIERLFALKVEKRRLTFLLIWAFSTAPLFLFRSGVLYGAVINSSIFAPLTLIFAAGIYSLFKIRHPIGFIFFVLVITSNFFLLSSENFHSNKIFAMQPLTLSTEKQLIDYTYKSAGNKPFSICGVTNPLFINTLWSFNYHTYGNSTYGYKPTWSGQKQVLNQNFLEDDRARNQIHYLIIEPPGGIPEYARLGTIYLEDRTTQLVEEKKFGDIAIQKRLRTDDKKLLRDTQSLVPVQKQFIENLVSNIDPRYHCSIEY